jgi:hypothetical protein
MQEIADWLTKLGLPEYAGAFAENGIDVSVLPHLTDQDLKDIGVLLGHRRKILAAVAELRGKWPSASKPPLDSPGDLRELVLRNRHRGAVDRIGT